MVSNVGTFAQNDLLRRRMLEIQTDVNRLQVQVSSGKKSDAYSGLGAVAQSTVLPYTSGRGNLLAVACVVSTALGVDRNRSRRIFRGAPWPCTRIGRPISSRRGLRRLAASMSIL